MPSGKVHNTINLSVISAATVIWHLTGQPFLELAQVGYLAAGALIGTLLITPDLDLGDQNVEAKNNWGVFGFIWYPYGKLSRHRGQAHSYLRGPLMRLLYLGAVITAVLYTLKAFQLWEFTSLKWPPMSPDQLMALGAGYVVAQWLHLIADGIYPWQKGRI